MNASDLKNKATQGVEGLLAPTIYLACLAVIGLFGNIFVLIVLSSKETPPSVYRTVILILAIYDMLLCGITLPFEIYDLHNEYTFQAPECVCKLVRTINYFLAFNSGLSVLLMTVDRFRRICRPLKAQMTLKTVRVSVFMIFLISLVSSLPNLWIRGIHTVHLENNITGYDCTISDEYINSKIPAIYFSILLLLCTAVILILIVLYAMIGHEIMKHFHYREKFLPENQKSENYLSSESFKTNKEYFQKADKPVIQTTSIKTGSFSWYISNNTDRNRKHSGKKIEDKGLKATKIAIVVSVMYILSYIPTLTENLLEAVYGESVLLNYVSWSVLHLLRRSFVINHAINPIIYGFMDAKFREYSKTIILVSCKR